MDWLVVLWVSIFNMVFVFFRVVIIFLMLVVMICIFGIVVVRLLLFLLVMRVIELVFVMSRFVFVMLMFVDKNFICNWLCVFFIKFVIWLRLCWFRLWCCLKSVVICCLVLCMVGVMMWLGGFFVNWMMYFFRFVLINFKFVCLRCVFRLVFLLIMDLFLVILLVFIVWYRLSMMLFSFWGDFV